MPEITRILCAIDQGDPLAAEQLLPLVYTELRKLAARKMSKEKPGQTLSPTALVHEAYLRLVVSPLLVASPLHKASPLRDASPLRKQGEDQLWDSRRHFFAAAAEAMRRILVERARRSKTVRHGGNLHRVDLDDALLVHEPRHDLLALDEALTRLANKQPIKAELVKLRFFAGLTIPEAAAALEISEATAERYWKFARSWLYAELKDPAQSSNS